eukprot:2122283-Alexandrium_andersonii.AAC.1
MVAALATHCALGLRLRGLRAPAGAQPHAAGPAGARGGRAAPREADQGHGRRALSHRGGAHP